MKFLRRRLASNRKLILSQVLAVSGLMRLLMKGRNTGEPWTPEERSEIRHHLWGIAGLVPTLAVFCLPGGMFLLPLLAEILDRRKAPRR